MTTRLARSELPTPVGRFVLFENDGRLVGAIFEDGESRLRPFLERRFKDLEYVDGKGTAHAALQRYLGGELTAIDGLEVDTGGTPFQQRVWAMLRRIPAGTTWSYARLARELEAPDALRAVGAANGANPVSIVVPCHRVIATDGTLHGYGGGLPRKQWLLEHEGVRLQGRLF